MCRAASLLHKCYDITLRRGLRNPGIYSMDTNYSVAECNVKCSSLEMHFPLLSEPLYFEIFQMRFERSTEILSAFLNFIFLTEKSSYRTQF